MTRQVIDTTTDRGTYRGDPGKTAWDKANLNFVELYQLFQSAANKLGYFDGNGKPAFTDITDFARSLLDDGSAAAARSTMGLGTAAAMSTLGPAVSGGASGALIERGSNANGSYVRFADGTQICWGVTQSYQTSAGSVNGWYYSSNIAFPFPAYFSASPSLSCISVDQTNSFSFIGAGGGPSTTGAAGILLLAPGSSATAKISWMAVGRWY